MAYYEFESEGTVTTYLNCKWIGSHNYPTDEIVGTYVGNYLRSGKFFISERSTSGLEKRTTIETKRYFRVGEDEIDENTEPYECVWDGR